MRGILELLLIPNSTRKCIAGFSYYQELGKCNCRFVVERIKILWRIYIAIELSVKNAAK